VGNFNKRVKQTHWQYTLRRKGSALRIWNP